MRIKMMIAVAVVALSGALATGAQAVEKAPTKVTIKAEGGGFYGKVKSTDPDECSDYRKVTVFKMLGSKPKPKRDEKVGYDTASLNGNHYEWSTGNSGQYEGHYYAKVKKSKHCRGAKSKVIEIRN